MYVNIMLVLSSVVLGGQHSLTNEHSMNFTQNVMKILDKDCRNNNTKSVFCDTVSKLKLIDVINASSQVVNGKLFDMTLKTNLGRLFMKLWLRAAPHNYIIQDFKLICDNQVDWLDCSHQEDNSAWITYPLFINSMFRELDLYR